MEKYGFMFIDTVFGFFALFTLTKILGKTQISQLTAFDFISAVVLGELVGNALFEKESGITEIAFLVIVWGGLLYIIELITLKFKRSRNLLEGRPAIVIHKGNIISEVLKKNNIDINEILHLLRGKDVFSVREVEYAVLETDGQLSVLKKAAYQTPNKKELNVFPNDVYLPISLITDGEIIHDNVKEAGLTEKWLLEELKRQNYNSVDEVVYAEYTKGEKLFVLPFTEKAKRKSD